MTVLLWVDAGASVGLGHVSRGLALADALREHGVACRFALAPEPTALAWLRADGQRDVVELQGSDALAQVLGLAAGVDAVIVDVRRPLDRGAVRTLRTAAPVLLIDNAGDGVADADLVVAPLGAVHDARWLVGPAWMPLRATVPPAPRAPRLPGPLEVLVSMGGSDPGALAVPVVEALATVRPAVVPRVIANPTAPVWTPLRDTMRRLGMPAPLAVEPGGLAQHFAAVDAAVLAFGVTVYEALASGVPTIVVCRTDDDVVHAQSLADAGALVSAGAHWRAEDVTRAVARVAGDGAVRSALAAAGPRVVDGRGAARVAAKLMTVLRSSGEGDRAGAGLDG